MNNYFIIGKVNEGKSHLFNLFSKTHKTISNPKANTTIDVIRKNISSENFEYNIYDTPGFYKFSDFTDLLNKISTLKLENIEFIYLISSFTNEDLKICKKLHSKNYNILLFSFKMIDEKDYISNLFNENLYFIDRSGKIAVYNPISSDIFWELDTNDTILSYLFSNDGYLILMTLNKILFLSDNGNIIYSYFHNKDSPISILNIKKNIYLISDQGISKLNMRDKKDDIIYKNKFTNNLEIFFKDQNIYLKDNKSLFKLSE